MNFGGPRLERARARSNGAGRPVRVLIAGGGFAALEAMLALRALAPDRVRVELVASSDRLAYRPAATSEPFSGGPPRAYDVAAIAADLDAGFHRDAVEAVAPSARRVRLGSGRALEYDRLILALGARPRASVPGALTFRDQRDVEAVRRIVEEARAGTAARVGEGARTGAGLRVAELARAGAVRRIVFAVPTGIAWAVPAYELALMTAASVDPFETEVALVTPERSPLELFGPDGSRLVRDLLAEREVRFVGATGAARFEPDGRLYLHFDGSLRADRVVAVPELRGPRIEGIPGDWNGFVPTDAAGRVKGLADVYAVGDMTAHPIKHGGLAAQQAERAAADVAGRAGAPVDRLPAPRSVHVRLLGGQQPLDLYAPVDGMAAAPAPGAVSGPPETKVFGRYLTPYLASRPPVPAAA